MGRIKGYYEWDDDGLVPGRKKEGGLHQNLFDGEGNLKGSARFVPDDGANEPLVITETVYLPSEERLNDDDHAARIDLVLRLIEIGVERLPEAVRWWKSTGRPMVSDAQQAARRFTHSHLKKRKETRTARDVAVLSAHEVTEASVAERPSMSRAEAQARYLAGLAARAYSDEQMGLVMSSDIVDMHGIEDLEESLRQLPGDQVRGVLEQMIKNPGMLADDTLADLASLLSRRSLRAPAPLTSDEQLGTPSPGSRSSD